MKRLAFAAILAAMAAQVQALDWEVEATLLVHERARINDSYVSGRGIHTLTVTQVHVLDYATFPQARIDSTKLQLDTITYDSCATNWTLIIDRKSHRCETGWTQDPCSDTVWEGQTQGTLRGHLTESGTMTDLATPVSIVCCA